MIDTEFKECIGCGACAIICPSKCISMKISEEGEYRPVIDRGSDCINCRLCEDKCVALHKIVDVHQIGNAYYGWSVDSDVRNSSSGGIAYVIAKSFLKDGGVVSGAVLDVENKCVFHKIISREEELKQLQGSKYVESYLGDVFIKIRENLERNVPVLFTGVPCQIWSLKTFLKDVKQDKLFTIEVFCHGAPRVGVFKKYLAYMETKYGKLKQFNFRSKKFGWNNASYQMKFAERVVQEKHENNIYHLMFGYHNSIRTNCYSCQYRGYERSADISLGDFWGIEKFYPEVDVRKGVSAVFINTEKGEQIFERLHGRIELYQCKTEEILEKNKWFIMNYDIPINQKKFDKNYKKLKGSIFIKKYEFLYKVWYRIAHKVKFLNWNNAYEIK